MICPHGGMTISRHNEIRDLIANWMSEVCRETETEPPLQPLSGEIILPRFANKQEDTRVDIKTAGLWGRQQSAFFCVMVFHPNAPDYRDKSVAALFQKYELDENMVIEKEKLHMVPLQHLPKEIIVVYKRLA